MWPQVFGALHGLWDALVVSYLPGAGIGVALLHSLLQLHSVINLITHTKYCVYVNVSVP